jgi:hypothetical protein
MTPSMCGWNDARVAERGLWPACSYILHDKSPRPMHQDPPLVASPSHPRLDEAPLGLDSSLRTASLCRCRRGSSAWAVT